MAQMGDHDLSIGDRPSTSHPARRQCSFEAKDGMSSLSTRTCRDPLSSSADVVRAGVRAVERKEARVSIVMGLDQHRAHALSR